MVETKNCQKLEADGSISYAIDYKEGYICLIEDIDANGTCGQERVSLESINRFLNDAGKGSTFKSARLSNLFEDTNANNPRFLAAALLNEGLIERTSERTNLILELFSID